MEVDVMNVFNAVLDRNHFINFHYIRPATGSLQI